MESRALRLLLTALLPCAAAAQPVTLRSLLRDMTSFATVARYPLPAYTLRQSSSYDRRSVSPAQPGWFANADFDQFIRTEDHHGHSEHVMLDADGPGAIVRFWLTTAEKPGTLRIYFDNADTPAIIAPAFDLMQAGLPPGPALLNPHSSYTPDHNGGNTLYLPLPYQRHCKVTWEYKDARRDGHYYQVNYRTYPAGTAVETFRPELLKKYRAAIAAAEYRLWHPDQPRAATATARGLIRPGDSLRFPMPPGPHAIRTLTASISSPTTDGGAAPAPPAAWRSVWLTIRFDGNTTVNCPLGDFIGSGEGGKPIDGWYRTLKGDTLTSRWVMPYAKSAVVTFTNRSANSIAIAGEASLMPWRRDDRSMYFHALFKYDPNVYDRKWDDTTQNAIDWNFVTIKGKGVYMGNTLAVDNHMDAWYGEGDAKAYVDGEQFPSEFGTGLEDYYNTSWAPVKLYQTPFANAPRADDPSSKGKNTFTRVLDLDAIPFTRAFSFDLEMLSWKGGTVDVGGTTYWYARP